MERMSRAGRKQEVLKVLNLAWRKDSHAVLFVGDVAKKMGLKSSTYLKNILRELVNDHEGVYMITTQQGDYFGYEPPRQVDFFDRVILINKQPTKVASWIQEHVVQ